MMSLRPPLVALVATCWLAGCGEPDCVEACTNIMQCKARGYEDQTLQDIRDVNDCRSRCADPEANRGAAAWHCADSESSCWALDFRCDVY